MKAGDWIDLSDILIKIIAGFWIYWKFIRERASHPKVTFDVNAKIIAIQDNKILVELEGVLENKGQVRHEIDGKAFTYKVRYIRANQPLTLGFTIKNNNTINQVCFPGKPINGEQRWVPKFGNTFIDGNCLQYYRATILLPGDTSAFLLSSEFKYRDYESDQHSIQKAFNINSLCKESNVPLEFLPISN